MKFVWAFSCSYVRAFSLLREAPRPPKRGQNRSPEASWRRLGPLLEAFWVRFGGFWRLRGSSWGHLGRFAAQEAPKNSQGSSQELPEIPPRSPKRPPKRSQESPQKAQNLKLGKPVLEPYLDNQSVFFGGILLWLASPALALIPYQPGMVRSIANRSDGSF